MSCDDAEILKKAEKFQSSNSTMADKVVQKGRQKHKGNSTERKGKTQQAHRKDVRVLGEAGGRPERLDFAGLKSWSEKKTCLITTIEGVLARFAG
jgi:hypothetical protein